MSRCTSACRHVRSVRSSTSRSRSPSASRLYLLSAALPKLHPSDTLVLAVPPAKKRDDSLFAARALLGAAGRGRGVHREAAKALAELWSEMDLAKKIQTVLLPKEPRIQGYELAAAVRPAEQAGGDYYDVFRQ